MTTCLKESMCRPQVVRSGFRRREPRRAHPRDRGHRAQDSSEPPLRLPATTMGQRTYPGPAGRGGGGGRHPPQHMERQAARPPRAALGLARQPRGPTPPPRGRLHVGPRPQAPETPRSAEAVRPRRPAGRDGGSASTAGKAGCSRPGEGGSRGKRELGPRRGRPAAPQPRLTVPPSLMMIFLASMILRFAARFFFFPWVILPSSTPGAAAATQGAGGPSGECGPATTAGPSRSGRTPPS